ncbi:MAG: hypothetical protein AB7V16_12665 [Vulcanibacillus sp.]
MPGFTNMVFDAKVMYAIYWYQKELGELPVLFYGMDDVQQGMFMDWFDEIIRNGATDYVLTKYSDLIKLFNTKKTSICKLYFTILPSSKRSNQFTRRLF